MKRNRIKSILPTVAVTIVLCGLTTFAQTPLAGQGGGGPAKTESKISYHNGPIMSGTPGVYLVWYGCWDETCGNTGAATAQAILTDFLSNLGGSPYFQINAMYPNGSGQAPSGALLYAGAVVDHYSHGLELTASDLAAIVSNQISSNGLPQDPGGIYVVVASADVSSVSTGFCVPAALPHHGTGEALGSQFSYAFVGNPNRCPSVAAPQFFSGTTQLPTPNGNLGVDAMVTMMAQVVSRVITNPTGGAWFDRYGLENAAKCVGQFGPTYATANGARANLRLGPRDYLIQQNWVRDRKEHCAMNSSL
jgi:Phosphate-induced protein 1 conserved region